MKNRNQMQKNHLQRIMRCLTALLLLISFVAVFFTYGTVSAASADYPAVFARISSYDNSRNINIAGYTDKTPVNTWPTNGGMNENWRFDLMGSIRGAATTGS